MISTKTPRFKVNVVADVNYGVFDLSGSLSFEIIFLLVRRAPKEVPTPTSEWERRRLLILVEDSLLDVHYALKHGFLRIINESDENKPVDFDGLETQPCEPKYITIDTGVDSGDVRYWKRTIEHSTKISPTGPIAKRLRPNQTYRLVIPNDTKDFPVKWCKLLENDEAWPFSEPADNLILYNQGHTPRVNFKTLSTLLEPPHVTVTLFAKTAVEIKEGEDFEFAVEVINNSKHALSVKSDGDQLFLSPRAALRAPYVPDRPRITCAGSNIPFNHVSLCRVETGEELVRWSEPSCTLTRPGWHTIRAELFTTLEPGVPFSKENSLFRILPKISLEPGHYRLRIPPLGVVWFWGTIHTLFQGQSTIKKYPSEPRHTLPIILESENELVFTVVE